MPQETRTARIEARIAPDALAIIKRAAEIEGRSLSDFVVAAAQEIARWTIEQDHSIRLSLDDQARFVELLLEPTGPNAALRRAKDAHDALIVKSR